MRRSRNHGRRSGMRASINLAPYLCVPALLFLSVNGSAQAAPAGKFSCGGAVEKQVWNTWDTELRDFMRQSVLRDRLVRQGDVYALYDFQMYMHSLVSMTQRCRRPGRLREIAEMIRVAYGALEPGPPRSPGRRWVCRGGGTCNEQNRLLNTEVMLGSVQFLALASFVANALASSGTPLGRRDRMFIADTMAIVTEHMVRWADAAAVRRLRNAANAKPDDLKDGSAALLFVDADLWLITIYAELGGLMRRQGREGAGGAGLRSDDDDNQRRMHTHLIALLKLFSARTSFQSAANGGQDKAESADIDRGYWRFYADNRYAGYEREDKPVVCRQAGNGKNEPKMEIRVPAESVRVPRDTGWDISHARRLVPALDALERNRTAIKSVFSVGEGDLPKERLGAAFADTLVTAVWNGDTEKPLFANYWSGANGWYRVAYDNGTGQCSEGYPPYGLSDSFLTGGYITWERYRPVIGILGRRLHQLIDSPGREDRRFISRYYPDFGPSAAAQKKTLSGLMFLPSLVRQRAGRTVQQMPGAN